MRILAIGAHPDDLELQCGGTLVLYSEQGHEVFIAIATDGGIGHPTATSRHEVAEMRHAEALASAKSLGATLIWMGFEDEWLFNDRTSRTRFIDAYREADPDVVITHSLNDYHPDHNLTGQIAVDARMPAGIRLLETHRPHISKTPHLFHMDTVDGTGFDPEFYVDITAVHDRKVEQLRYHDSQHGWLSHFFGMEYVDFMTMKDSRRGAECGVKYAEGFRQLPTFPRTGDASLLPGPTLLPTSH